MCEAFDEHAHECAVEAAVIYDTLIAPFVEFAFMRRALVGSIALALGAGPVGVFLMLRRMSLVGDAMAHAILPGAAIGFLLSGLSLFAMTAGGLIAGFVIALGAGVVARATELKEDASLAAFFLISLAVGVTIVSLKGNNVDLLHFLFGSVLALDDPTLLLIAAITTLSLAVLAVIYRPLVLECVDPGFLRSVSRAGAPAHIAFLALVVMNLVGGFHALGTLLAVGIMMLPAVIARFWARDITSDDRDRGRERRDRRLCRPAASRSTPARRPAPRSSWSRAGSTRRRSCSGRAGGLVGQLFPGRHLEA